MVRNRTRKTTIGLFSAEKMDQAVSMIINKECSIREAAKRMELKYQTVAR